MQKEMEFKYLVCSPDLNAHGSLHGGVLVRWCDESSGMHAKLITNKVCVTRFIDKINFISKAKLGDIIQIKTKIIYAGKTSICFNVKVSEGLSKRDIAEIDQIIFVSIDKDGNSINHNLNLPY